MTPEEFLIKRFQDILYYRDFYVTGDAIWSAISKMVAINVKTVEFHKNWPVLVEGQPEMTVEQDGDNLSYKMSQRMAWMTEQEYIKRFGTRPPLAPLIRDMLEQYQDHPDFDPEWLGGSDAQ